MELTTATEADKALLRSDLGLGSAAQSATGDFAAASHTHAGYAASSHTHPYLPLSGNALTALSSLSDTDSIVMVRSGALVTATVAQLKSAVGTTGGTTPSPPPPAPPGVMQMDGMTVTLDGLAVTLA